MNKSIAVKSLIFILLLGGIGFGYIIFQKKKQDLYESALKGLNVGKAYGKLVPQSDCLPALRMHYSNCNDDLCNISAHGFISGCLGVASDDGFCKSVPSPEDTKNAVSWANKTCLDIGMQNTLCNKFVHKALSTCLEKNTGEKTGAVDSFRQGFNRGIENSK